MHTGLEGKHDCREAFAVGILGRLGGLRPRQVSVAQGQGGDWLIDVQGVISFLRT